MVLDALGDALRNTLRKIAGASHISPELIKEQVRDIQRALLQSGKLGNWKSGKLEKCGTGTLEKWKPRIGKVENWKTGKLGN